MAYVVVYDYKPIAAYKKRRDAVAHMMTLGCVPCQCKREICPHLYEPETYAFIMKQDVPINPIPIQKDNRKITKDYKERFNMYGIWHWPKDEEIPEDIKKLMEAREK